ncbi:hypothetical protein TNCV_1808051 [Trichonephila clavipes]|nr:hypothetical protein TNCV_1808051 [Trichonephila clavipes]
MADKESSEGLRSTLVEACSVPSDVIVLVAMAMEALRKKGYHRPQSIILVLFGHHSAMNRILIRRMSVCYQ